MILPKRKRQKHNPVGKKRRATRKELEQVVNQVITQMQRLYNEFLSFQHLFSVYLKWRKHDKKFNDFIEAKLKDEEQKIGNTPRKETLDRT